MPEELVTDNMSALVSLSGGRRRRVERAWRFADEAGFRLVLCAPRSPETKGKDESANRFLSRLAAYEGEFAGWEGLRGCVARIEARSNEEPNATTGLPPAALFMREKESLRPVGNMALLESMVGDVSVQVVPPTMLVRAAGRQWSVPRRCIGRRVSVVAMPGGQVRVRMAGEEVAVHDPGAAAGPIVYEEAHYLEALEGKRWADGDIREVAAREARIVRQRIRSSGFPYVKGLADFDWDFQPSVPRARVEELATLRFIERAENVLLVGSPGVGKTHLAVAIGIEAVRAGREARFMDCARLVEDLQDAQARGILKKRLKYYAHSKLLVIDELGYLDIGEGGADLLFQLISTRYEQRSTIITTNVGIGGWGKVFGDDVAASAIADRVCHHCHVIKITGRSYRLKDLPRERRGGD